MTWEVTSVSVTLGQREINCELVKTTKGNTFSTLMVLPESNVQATEFVDLQHLFSQMLKHNRSQTHHVSHVWWLLFDHHGWILAPPPTEMKNHQFIPCDREGSSYVLNTKGL